MEHLEANKDDRPFLPLGLKGQRKKAVPRNQWITEALEKSTNKNWPEQQGQD